MNTTKLIDTTCAVVGITHEEFYRHTRNGGKSKMSRARSIVAKILRQEEKWYLKRIGDLLGGFDHSSVIYMIETVSNDIRFIPEVREQYIEIKRRMNENKKDVYIESFIVKLNNGEIDHIATNSNLIREISRLRNVETQKHTRTASL